MMTAAAAADEVCFFLDTTTGNCIFLYDSVKEKIPHPCEYLDDCRQCDECPNDEETAGGGIGVMTDEHLATARLLGMSRTDAKKFNYMSLYTGRNGIVTKDRAK